MVSLFSRIIAPIAAIMSFRMLGLFMLIPVFTVYAPDLKGATPTLIGIALGSYGLSQGLLQIPFGLLSDRYGRKSIITIGLLIFAFGSLLGAFAHSITGMIVARILQGMGAIGSVLIALLADLTPNNQRTFAMAIIGSSIGVSFGIAFIISPFIASHYGLSGIFYLTTFFALNALLLLHLVIPTPNIEATLLLPAQNNYRERLKNVLINPHLQRLNIGIFCQHLILTATFFVVPLRLQDVILHHQLNTSWHFYALMLSIAFAAMIPIIIFAEKKQYTKQVFVISVFITGLCQLGLLCFPNDWPMFAGTLLIYFIVFNVPEAMLPSIISRQAPAANKGAAMGVYSSSQFLGIFAGGTLAGIVYQISGSSGIYVVNALVAFIWIFIARPMKLPYQTHQPMAQDSV